MRAVARPAEQRGGRAASRAARPAGRAATAAVIACYLLAAAAVTWRLWADPATHVVAGNPHDADQFAFFLRYDAAAISRWRLPALVTAALNAPQGVSVMWNNFLLLPGILLAPVTLAAGPQVSLTVLTTAGFAGSAASMFAVLRRWQVSLGAAALAGAVYGFSPALLQSAIGHYPLLAILPPLIVDAALRLCLGQSRPLRGGIRLGLLVTAQLFTGEEVLAMTCLATVILVAALAAGRPSAVAARAGPAAAGCAVAAAVTLALAGYPLWVQFFGPLTQHGSAFTPGFFVSDISSFVTPSRYLLFHTAASAASAARYQGGAPEYLAYLGWPLIVVLAVAAVTCWRTPAVRALAVTLAVLELLSLGPHPLVSGRTVAGVTLPWAWLQNLPVVGAALPDRLPIVAGGAAAALLAFAVDEARKRWAMSARGTAVLAGAAVLAVLPLVPLPLPAASAPAVPAGWQAAFGALRLPPGARVLVVPVPTPVLTAPMRWQADTGEPAALIGGYFTGPAWNGQAYIGGNGVTAAARYLDGLWHGRAPAGPGLAQLRAQIAAWQPAAVVAVTSAGSKLGRRLLAMFGQPSVTAGAVLAWRR